MTGAEATTWTANATDLVRNGFQTSASIVMLLLATLAVAMIVTVLFLGIRRVRHHHPRHGAHVRTRHS